MATLIATLGEQPQVVTLALDLLRAQGEKVEEVRVIHTRGREALWPPAVVRLQEETAYYGPAVAFHFHLIQAGDEAPWDILSEEDASAAFTTLYRVLKEAKRQRKQIHLSLAGGRKVMSAYALAAAQMLFDADDRCWHLISEGPLLQEGRMHRRPGDRVQLVPVPVLRWSTVSPVFTALAQYDDPWAAVRVQNELVDREARQRVEAFLATLTPAERQLAELLAAEGLSNQALAARLHRSEKTVANQLSSIYRKYYDFWGHPGSRSALIAELGPAVRR